MKAGLQSLLEHWRRRAAAYLVFLISLAPTLVAYYQVDKYVAERARSRFNEAARTMQDAIEQRVNRYVDELMGVQGLFTASLAVNREEWRRYVQGTDMPRRYPGLGVMAYVERVPASARESHVRKVRQDGLPNYNLQTPGVKAEYFPVVYNYGAEAGRVLALGWDAAADPVQRLGMEAARDTGQPVATGTANLRAAAAARPITCFFVLLPLYRDGQTPPAEAERRAALQGFIVGALTPVKMLEGLFARSGESSLRLEIQDESTGGGGATLFDSDGLSQAAHASYEPRFSSILQTPVLNRVWHLHFTTQRAFETEAERYLPWTALLAGLMLNFLLFGITLKQADSRSSAERLAAELRESEEALRQSNLELETRIHEREQAEEALRAEKELLAVTLGSIGDGVITTDADGKVILFNPVAEELTGWMRSEAAGKSLHEVFQIIDGKTREPRANPVEMAMLAGKTVMLPDQTVLITRDSTELTIAHSAAPIRGKDNRIAGAVLAFEDITEKVRSEAELLRASKLESVGVLAGGIAHGFNNILTSIIGNLALARMFAHSVDKIMARLGDAERAALRAKDLTQQLLTFAKGGAPIKKTLQLHTILRESAELALTESSVHAEYALPADLWAVEGDDGQVRQVLNNIVLNARQAMPDGGRVEVRAENVELTGGFLPPLPAGKYVKMAIRDFGVGIVSEHLPKIFDPYFTTKEEASGLGLATAYSIVVKHGGQIRVESAVGQGTTISIYLPASAKQVEPVPIPETKQPSLFGRGRVLVMDDEEDIRIIASAMLEAIGYEVDVAKDGEEAIVRYLTARAAGKPFGAVIMDLSIPNGMGGKETIRRLKELDPEVRAIVSSGYSYDPVMANFRDFGFLGVMPKPYKPVDLAQMLKEVLSAPLAGASTATRD